jgi:hypothetical protein
VLAKLGVTTAKHARRAYLCICKTNPVRLPRPRRVAESFQRASKEFPIWPLSFPGELCVPSLRGRVISPVW